MEKKIRSLEELSELAKLFVASHPEGAVVGLSGELGAGKTTFVKACIAEIAGRDGKPLPRVTSPSFVLHQEYADLSQRVDHFDLYRLEAISEESLLELGYFECLDQRASHRGFVFVEWPEHVVNRSHLQLGAQVTILLEPGGRVFLIN